MTFHIFMIFCIYELLYNYTIVCCNCCSNCCCETKDINTQDDSDKDIHKTQDTDINEENTNSTNVKKKQNIKNKIIHQKKYKKYQEQLKNELNNFDKYNENIKDKDLEDICATVSNHKCGFKNLGNTCYMNSALQFLLKIKPFIKSIIKNIKECTENEKLANKPVTLELFYLISKIFFIEKSNSNLSLEENLKTFQYIFLYKDTGTKNYIEKKEDFLNGNQCDPEEFTRTLLEDLEKENGEENLQELKISIKSVLKCHKNKNHEKNSEVTIDQIFKVNICGNKNQEFNLSDLIKNNKENLTENNYVACKQCSKESIEKTVKKKKIIELMKTELLTCDNCKEIYNSTGLQKIEPGSYIKLKEENIKEIEPKKKYIGKVIFNCDICNQIFNYDCTKCKNIHEEYCNSIQIKNIKTKIDSLENIDKYLIVQIARFHYKNGNGKKLKTKINFEKELILNINKTNVKLGLESIIVHYGNINFGHYIAYKKIENKWFEFNDSNSYQNEIEIDKNKIKDDIKENCYLLLYKKIE